MGYSNSEKYYNITNRNWKNVHTSDGDNNEKEHKYSVDWGIAYDAHLSDQCHGKYRCKIQNSI